MIRNFLRSRRRCAAHSAYATTAAIVKFVPKAVAGLLMEQDLKYFHMSTRNSPRPYVAILGGAMASTFLKLQGVRVCKSPVENDKLGLAKSLLAKPGNKLMLPVDHVVVNEVKQGAANEVVDTIAEGQIGADIGQRKERIP